MAFGVAFLGLGILGEILQAVQVHREVVRVLSSFDPSPPDGESHPFEVPGLRSIPNSQDSRFGRLQAVEATETPPSPGRGPLPEDLQRAEIPMLGRVVVVSIYVGCDGRGWTEEEIAESHRAMIRAGRWVEGEALRLRVAMNVDLATPYVVMDDRLGSEVLLAYQPEGDGVGPMEESGDAKAIVVLSQGSQALGLRDFPELVHAFESRIAADSVAWLVHMRRRGRSYAFGRESSWRLGLPVLRLAVCYCRESSFPEPLEREARTDPVTVVHELLHLFGATDKDLRSLSQYPRGQVTSHDVMRLSRTRLQELRIDPLSAAEIGWGLRTRESPAQRPTADGSV